jgi:hypothetical protein
MLDCTKESHRLSFISVIKLSSCSFDVDPAFKCLGCVEDDSFADISEDMLPLLSGLK